MPNHPSSERGSPWPRRGCPGAAAAATAAIATLATLATLAAAPAGAAAAPSLPWTPGPLVRHALELLVDDGGLPLPLTQWPLPEAAVRDAVEALPSDLPDELAAARAVVLADLRANAQAQLRVLARGPADELAGFGDESTPGSSLAWRSGNLGDGNVALQLGLRGDTHPAGPPGSSHVRPEDSALVLQVAGVQLQAFEHRAWWGPGWQSALALSDNAPSFAGASLQRAAAGASDSPWLHWMGPWNLQSFIAQEEGVVAPDHPFIVGTRLTFKPFERLELGLTQMMQWGGRGRPESPASLLRAFIGNGTNPLNAQGQRIDPANLLAGYDARLRCPQGLHCAVYGQLIGEDEASHLPAKFLGQLGGEWWSADGEDRVFAEYIDSSCRKQVGDPPIPRCAYRNYAYPSGYTSGLRWIGAGIGPDSRLWSLGWIDAPTRTTLRLFSGHVASRIGTWSDLEPDPAWSGRMRGLAFRREVPVGAATFTPEIDLEHLATAQGNRFYPRVGLAVGMPLSGAAEAAAPLWESDTRRWGWLQAFEAIALLGASTALDVPADRYALHHTGTPFARGFIHVGDALPLLEAGATGLEWAAGDGFATRSVAFVALESATGAVLTTEALKVAVDRARPAAGLGASSFGQVRRSDSAFPSGHTTLAWSLVTPFAEGYGMPWLYAIAGATNASRVLGREHWVSDTVAGALIGYTWGDQLYRRSGVAGGDGGGSHLALGARSVAWTTPF